MITNYVTFSVGRKEQWEHADPDGWLEVTAPSDEALVQLLKDVLGETSPGVIDCAFIYSSHPDPDGEYFPHGCIARIGVTVEVLA